MNSFKRNLIIGYGFSLILLLVSTVASFISIRSLLHNTDLVNKTNLVIQKLENTISLLKDAETGQRGFLLTGEEQFLEPYNGTLDKVYEEVKDLRVLIQDNQLQQLTLIKLTDVIQTRMSRLQSLIDVKRDGQEVSNEVLRQGRANMDEARRLVTQMTEREKMLLQQRVTEANKFAEQTPVLIIAASLLSILITIISFLRVNGDFSRRLKLQEELKEKDRNITERINIISGIAEKVSGGDYNIRMAEGAEDKLGLLAASLNKMTGSLHEAFTALSDKEWLQTGLSELNEKILGEQTIETVAKNVLEQLVSYTGSDIGAFYHYDGKSLAFIQGHAFRPPADKMFVRSGEGLVGQALASGNMLTLNDIPASDILISYAAGELKPGAIAALPIKFEGNVKGVILLGAVKFYQPNDIAYLQSVAENIAIVINTAETRSRLDELLQETQAQSEELSAQHSELESVNSELEAQAEKLQVSEEELKVQQEELLQSNGELEERTRLLEERNQVISEQNRDIETKAVQLEQSAKYKSEFLANMSHELRTPLNSILLLSRLMSDNHEKNLTNDQVEYARVIQSSGHGLLSLIDEILDLSKIEAGKMEMDYSLATVEEIIANMRSLFKPVAADKGLELHFEVDANVPAAFETDIMRFEQVLKNLLSNALKFTSKGSVTLHIKEAAGGIVFEVTDTGIGISKDKQQLVFEAFQQEDGSTRRNYGGTGLGLSISREIVKLLGGEISLRSEQQKGSSFTVQLPLLRPSAAATPATHAVEYPKQEANKNKEPDFKSYRHMVVPESIADDRSDIKEGDKLILIIEDDTAFASALLDFTHRNGYKGIVAVRGDEGVSLARQYIPMGILLDVYLPVMDGWMVLERLKADMLTKHIPVHVMSSIEVKTKSLTAGAVDFINKPLAIEGMREIFKKIEEVINKTSRKVLIVEENSKHAKALAYFLDANDVNADISDSIGAGIAALQQKETDCVILDMGVPAQESYNMLEEIKKTPGLENIPIIVFTGKSLSHAEEVRIKKYADSIVVKTAHSYKRLLEEVSLFLHLMEKTKPGTSRENYKHGMLKDVLNNKKVLLVDDDVRNIYSLTRAMEHHNIVVVSAIDGKDALKQLEANKDVQLVLMDMMMPEMDGYETTRQIRTNRQHKNLPIIAVTAKAMTGDREKCIQAGASDYITKPVDTDQLLSLLRVWLYDKN